MRYSLLILLLFFKPSDPDNPMLNFIEKESPLWISSESAINTNQVDSTLTVVSFNIEFALRLDEAIRELSSYPYKNADIILLQEMDERGTLYISEELEYNYLYFPMSRHPKHRKNFGNAILSKWPIMHPEKIILPHAQPLNRLKRGATSGIIKYGTIDIKVYSLHLETPVLSRKKRLQQLQRTIDTMNASDHTDLIIFGGDFNSLFPQDVVEMVNLCQRNELEWNTRQIGHTLRKYNVIRPTLDHIFSKGFDLLAAGKTKKSLASDHFPIWAKLKINNSQG